MLLDLRLATIMLQVSVRCQQEVITIILEVIVLQEMVLSFGLQRKALREGHGYEPLIIIQIMSDVVKILFGKIIALVLGAYTTTSIPSVVSAINPM